MLTPSVFALALLLAAQAPKYGVGRAPTATAPPPATYFKNVRRLAVDRVPHSGKSEELIQAFGISARHIVAVVEQMVRGN